jgi:flagellar biogenesis protein FliO
MIIPVIAVLLVLLAAAAVALWQARRRGVRLALGAHGRRLRVIERLALSRQAALLLVEFDRRTLLIGQNSDRLTLLSEKTDDPA